MRSAIQLRMIGWELIQNNNIICIFSRKLIYFSSTSTINMPSPNQIFTGGGGGYSWLLKSQSAKSWPNFHFRRAGVFLATQNSKCQVLTKFSFSKVGGGGFLATQNSKCHSYVLWSQKGVMHSSEICTLLVSKLYLCVSGRIVHF